MLRLFATSRDMTALSWLERRVRTLSTLIERLDRFPGGMFLQVVLLFAIVRATHLVWSWSAPLKNDAASYDHLAVLLTQGKPWLSWFESDWQFGPVGTPTAVRAPGLPVFLAGIYAIVGHHPEVARVVLVALNAFAAGVLFSTCRRHWGPLPAVAVSLAWTFWPVSVRALYYVDSLLAESLAVPLLIFTLWALTRDGFVHAALAGLFLGLAVLTRPHLALAIPFTAGIALLALRGRSARRDRNKLFACAFVAGLCLLPWTARNYVAFQKFMPLSSQTGIGLWIGWADGTTGTWDDRPHEKALAAKLHERHPGFMSLHEGAKSDVYARAAFEAIRERGPVDMLRRVLWKAWLHIRPWETFYGFHSALLIATVLALLARRGLWATPAAAVASSVYLALLATSIITYYLGRYRFINTPALLFLAAGGLASLLERQPLTRRLFAWGEAGLGVERR